MPAQPAYIQVLLPLRLEWEPYYRTETPVAVGDRVQVLFSGRRYIGVVSAVNVSPDPGIGHILQASPSPLPPVSEREIAYWRAIAEYYLCSVGEVYKIACPEHRNRAGEVAVRLHERLQKRLETLQQKVQKARTETTRARYEAEVLRTQAALREGGKSFSSAPVVLSKEEEALCQSVQDALPGGKPILLSAGKDAARSRVYRELARQTLLRGKSVLYLVPDAGLAAQREQDLAEVFPGVMAYHSGHSAPQRYAVEEAVRTDPVSLVLGTRSALFLPWRNLGMIIVDQEQDAAHKQGAPGPRYHARESAIMLAALHGAAVVLGSESPSLESLYNASSGRFTRVAAPSVSGGEITLVNLVAEARKKGLPGRFSLKLLEQVHSALKAGERVLLVYPFKAALEEGREELENLFPEVSARALQAVTPAGARSLREGSSFGLVAILQADALLGKEDFRSDERALNLLRELRRLGHALCIQTREPSHPVFKALEEGADATAFLEERRLAQYPPYSRLLDIRIEDSNPRRLAALSKALAQNIGPCLGPYTPPSAPEDVRVIRITLPRDKSLRTRKSAVYQSVLYFEKEHRYPGHLYLDVDPA